jgi:type I restriction enzyme, R subunit
MSGPDKKALTERDICTKFITPALVGFDGAKWNVMTQLREEYFFTKGRVIVRGKTVKRGEAKKADYLLFYRPNIPIAVIEAKDNNHSVGAGMQQALEYAEILDVPFVYSSNGDAFLEHDRTLSSGRRSTSPPLCGSRMPRAFSSQGDTRPTPCRCPHYPALVSRDRA